MLRVEILGIEILGQYKEKEKAGAAVLKSDLKEFKG